MKRKFGLVISLVLLLLFVSCKNNVKSENTIIVAASLTPHVEILNQVKDMMKEKGYELIIKEFSDYVQPNFVVENGEVDANYFQHQPYLESFNEEKNTYIVSVGSIYYEPFGIYSETKNSLDLSNGDKIAVPNDTTNEARALLLLEDAGLIKLKSEASLNATKLDIIDNPKNLDIVELEAAQIPRSLDSVALECMNGNYAVEANFKVKDAIYVEKQDSEAATTYANILCVKEGRQNDKIVLDLYECLKSDVIKDYIDSKYEGSVIGIE